MDGHRYTCTKVAIEIPSNECLNEGFYLPTFLPTALHKEISRYRPLSRPTYRGISVAMQR
ncbi:MAG: hypothetical protein NC403_05520 [Muribaculaceae bacterium]|nr:hypothetical protein [Muribaculaceae bacterium]